MVVTKVNNVSKGFYFVNSVLLAHVVKKPVILCFHRVKGPSDSLLDRRVGFTTPKNFEKSIQFMKSMRYKFVSLENLISMIEIGKFRKIAAITFDDGFRDLYENAFPILKRYKIPFTLFLITSLIDSTELLWLHKLYIYLDRLPLSKCEAILKRYSDFGYDNGDLPAFIGKIIRSADKEDIRELVAAVSSAANVDEEEEKKLAADLYLSKKEIEEMKIHGLTVEPHGHEHWPLTNLSEKDTEKEIVYSKEYIENVLCSSAKFYGLPAGTSNRFTRHMAKSVGLKGIATIESNILTERSIDHYRLPRVCVYNNMVGLYRVMFKNFARYSYQKLFK